MMIILAALLIITGLYLLCLHPNTGRREAMKAFWETDIAHRGYFNNEGIPLFSEVLKAVNGKVPLIVEIKASERHIRTTERVTEVLQGYSGKYCIESFNPFVVRWYRKNRPEVLRGQLSTNYFKDRMGKTPIDRFVMTNLLLNFLTRPDFIAYNHKHARQFSYRLCRKLYGVVGAAWTVRDKEERLEAMGRFEIFIVEGAIWKNETIK